MRGAAKVPLYVHPEYLVGLRAVVNAEEFPFPSSVARWPNV